MILKQKLKLIINLHGVLKVYDDGKKEFTKAKFLTNSSIKKPVFLKSWMIKYIEKDKALIMMDKVNKASTEKFIKTIADHRFWPRQKSEKFLVNHESKTAKKFLCCFFYSIFRNPLFLSK